MKNIAVLVSGGGTNLQALIDYEKEHADCPYHISVVMSTRKDVYAIERAKNAGIPVELVGPYAVLGAQKAKEADRDTKRLATSDKILEYSKKYEVELIVLAGCLVVLTGAIHTEYKDRIINLHPALLPKFGGVGMWGEHVHEAVLAAGEKESGCTVHIADSGCDTGRILVQRKVPVMPDDTIETLYARIAPEEKIALLEAVLMMVK
ncbi:MAG: phosphoribosylglycinamide formyltransferase [Treponema sp.]|nr:phosphoribosylglycinamide formyltransferase [Treponema sp.]